MVERGVLETECRSARAVFAPRSDWESTTPPDSSARRAARTLLFTRLRSSARRVSCMRSTVTSSGHETKYPCTVCQCGRSLGMILHAQPVRVM